ncbi:MAG TPA: cellulase family glycosylhydrolase [Beijerinckiaceae bacterium]|nr:cellulase family glycosylhydrolase [Beijerinckiaceae bacterium]
MLRPISRRAFTAGAALAGLAGLASGLCASEPRAPFRRGVSIHNLMNWGQLEPNDKTRYRWPPFASVHHQLQPQIYDNLVEAGFDFVRLTLDPGVFLQASGQHRADLDAQLLTHVKKFQGLGLGVIVDFHPNSQVPDYAPEKITENANSALFKDYGAMLERTALLLKPLTGSRVAFELMNEPQWGWDGGTAARWQKMLEIWHERVRSVAPDLMLVLTGARGGNIDGLRLMDAKPFAGSNTLWTFHYYEPYELTHAGVHFTDPKARTRKYFSDLPYPGAPEHLEDAMRIIAGNIGADTALSAAQKKELTSEARTALAKYLEARPGRKTIKAQFDTVVDWAKRNNIANNHIFLGEFGVTRTYGRYRASPPAPLKNWLSDVREEAEARGFGWALWVLSGYGGMSLIETDESVRFDGPTLEALGLKAG